MVKIFTSTFSSNGNPKQVSKSIEDLSALGKLKTRNGQVRTAAPTATPPINVPRNDRRFMRRILA